MNPTNMLPFMLAVSTLVGCRASDHTEGKTAPPASASVAPPPASIPPQSILDALDRRAPVPLLPMMANHQKQNMRDHLLVVQEIVTAVAAKDFDAVQNSVRRIGYSEQMGQMCDHMGAGATGFTELALKFHHSADKIGNAAKTHDSNGVLEALSDTLALCTSCHQTFRQQVVDHAAWVALTKMPTPAGSEPR